MTSNRIFWYIVTIGIVFSSCNRLDEDLLNSEDQTIEIDAAIRPENSAMFNFANSSQLDKNNLSLQINEYPNDGTIRILDEGKILFYGDEGDNGKKLSFSGTISDTEQSRKFRVRLSVSDTVRNNRSQECPSLLSFTYKANQGEIFQIDFQPVLDTLPECIFNQYNFDNISVIGFPENGVFTISDQPLKELIFIPNEGFKGTDMVTIKIPSNQNEDDLHMVFAFHTYACFADVEDDFYTVEFGATNVLLNVLENDSICNLPINSMAILSGPNPGNLAEINENNQINYTPAAYSEPTLDSLVYELCFGGTICKTAKVLINNSDEEFCFAQAHNDSVKVNTTLPEVVIDILANDQDCGIEWQYYTFEFLYSNDPNAFSFSDGILTVFPENTSPGENTLTIYQICNVINQCTSASIKITYE